MKRTASATPLSSPRDAPLPSPAAQALHKPAFILFLCVFAVSWAALLLGIESPPARRWFEGLLLPSAVATLLVGLARRLPFQNVITSSALIALASGMVIWVGEETGIPFGPVMFNESFAWRIFGTVPWPMPLLWIAFLISARGVARLMVRPWRKTHYYGFWIIGLTILLALILDLGLEPHAARTKHYWIWRASSSAPNWYGAPWTNFLGWTVASLGIVVFTTPWLINKQPVKRPTDYHPLIVWMLLNGYLVTSNAVHHCWLSVVISVVTAALALIFAIRGGRW